MIMEGSDCQTIKYVEDSLRAVLIEQGRGRRPGYHDDLVEVGGEEGGERGDDAVEGFHASQHWA